MVEAFANAGSAGSRSLASSVSGIVAMDSLLYQEYAPVRFRLGGATT